jgi:hypothetical protein
MSPAPTLRGWSLPLILLLFPPVFGNLGAQSASLASVGRSGTAGVSIDGQFDRWFTTLSGANSSAVAVDRQGNIYIAGDSYQGLPTTTSFPPPPDYYHQSGFLLRLDPTGSKVQMGSYLGGVVPRQIVVDSAGYAYILGWHTEHGSIGIVTGDAPITQNAVQTSPNSIPLDNGVTVTPTLMKLTPDGQIVYTTFLGGIA